MGSGEQEKKLGYGMFNVRTLTKCLLFLTSSLPSEPLKTVHGKLTLKTYLISPRGEELCNELMYLLDFI